MPLYEDIISPPKRIISINWRELFHYRDLFWVLAWRDFAVRYKQTALGMFWAIFRPLISMLVFTFVFSKGLDVKGDPNTPYPVFVYVGQLFWLFFSETLSNASNSMVANAAMIQKIYFPRLILPATTILTGFVDFGIASLVLTGLMYYFKITPNWIGLLLVPVLLLITSFTTLGVGMFFASLNVKYRDVKHALPFIIQLMMFVSPIIYPVTQFDKFPFVKELMFWLNPMAGVITNARAGILGSIPLDLHALMAASIMSVVYFVFGLYYFRQTERYFADIV
jgi:lipopolysaccharide transport system permease protein